MARRSECVAYLRGLAMAMVVERIMEAEEMEEKGRPILAGIIRLGPATTVIEGYIRELRGMADAIERIGPEEVPEEGTQDGTREPDAGRGSGGC